MNDKQWERIRGAYEKAKKIFSPREVDWEERWKIWRQEVGK